MDPAINLFPFPLDFGRNPKVIFIHITDLTQLRLTERRVLLEDAHRSWPHLAMRVKNLFIEDFHNHTTVLRRFKPSQRLVEAILLTRGPSHNYGHPPAFHLGNDTMPRNVSFHEWYIFHINKTLDGVHLDTFWCWVLVCTLQDWN